MTSKDGARIYNELSNLNSYSGEAVQAFVEEALYDHRTLQQRFMRNVVLPFLRGQARNNKEGYFDLRNEGTTRLAAALVELVDDLEIGLPDV